MPGQDFKGQGHYDNVKSSSNHDATHQHPLTNDHTKCKLPTPYVSIDLAAHVGSCILQESIFPS